MSHHNDRTETIALWCLAALGDVALWAWAVASCITALAT